MELLYYIAFAGEFWGSKLQQFKTCLSEWETEMHPWGAFSYTLNIVPMKTDANLAKWNMTECVFSPRTIASFGKWTVSDDCNGNATLLSKYSSEVRPLGTHIYYL